MAHQGRPEAPSYAGEVLEIRDSTDGSVVDPAITVYAARTGRQGRDPEASHENADDKPRKGGGRGREKRHDLKR